MKVSYGTLDATGKNSIALRLAIRREIYVAALEGEAGGSPRILIVGDKPGPSAPTDGGYVHTPFYSTKHCSGWLNTALHLEGIPEEGLVWINSADREGEPTDFSIVEKLMLRSTIALGGNAEKWLRENGWRHTKVSHPQYHKRFRNSERYELLDILKGIMRI